MSDRDNVATALEPLDQGRVVSISGRVVKVTERVPPGHKIALVDIAQGQAVVKYGSPIGTAMSGIAAGAHVHTHNLASGRGRGDLAASGRSPLELRPRLAEPDERNGLLVDGPGAGGTEGEAPA